MYHLSQAGIDTEMLTVALEPEVAALYVKHLPVDKRIDGKEGDEFQTFSPGSTYIVVDAGGLFWYQYFNIKIMEISTCKECENCTTNNVTYCNITTKDIWRFRDSTYDYF